MPELTNQKLNPEVKDIEVGVRHLRKVTFYPLAFAHERKLKNIMKEVFAELVTMAQGDSNESIISFASKAVDIIEENIELIVGMVCEEDPSELLADVTNSQMVSIVEYVYKTNFEGPVKNLLNLFQGEGEKESLTQSILEQLQPQSVKPTDTDSKTSTKKGTEKAALRSAK